MKIAFLGVRVPGHLNPTTALARKLKAREHDVLFLSVPDTESFVRAAQLPYVPFCENDFPVGSLGKSLAQLREPRRMETTVSGTLHPVACGNGLIE
jgi:UDP:flavonoid glycosyltransferase YjiC (YdhE family)